MKEVIVYHNSVALFREVMEQPTQDEVVSTIRFARAINVMWDMAELNTIRRAAVAGLELLDWDEVGNTSVPFDQNGRHFSIRVLEVKDIGK